MSVRLVSYSDSYSVSSSDYGIALGFIFSVEHQYPNLKLFSSTKSWSQWIPHRGGGRGGGTAGAVAPQNSGEGRLRSGAYLVGW